MEEIPFNSFVGLFHICFQYCIEFTNPLSGLKVMKDLLDDENIILNLSPLHKADCSLKIRIFSHGLRRFASTFDITLYAKLHKLIRRYCSSFSGWVVLGINVISV